MQGFRGDYGATATSVFLFPRISSFSVYFSALPPSPTFRRMSARREQEGALARADGFSECASGGERLRWTKFPSFQVNGISGM